MRVIKIVTVCCLISIISILIYKNINGKPFGGLRSTDLSKINIDNIYLGENIHNVDLSKYIPNDTLSDYDYNFNKLRLNVDSSGKINKILVNHSEGKLLSINGTTDLNNISDIRDKVGRYYKDLTFDKEQKLNFYKYVDKDSKIIAKFVYSTDTNELVWSILEKTD